MENKEEKEMEKEEEEIRRAYLKMEKGWITKRMRRKIEEEKIEEIKDEEKGVMKEKENKSKL